MSGVVQAWRPGDREPSAAMVRAVTAPDGRRFVRSPHGYFWYPDGGGRIRLWDELLAEFGEVMRAQAADGPLTLFDVA